CSHFIHYPIGKHLFHSTIDALVKLRAVAKDKDTCCSRFAVRSVPAYPGLSLVLLAPRGGYSPLRALLGDGFAAQQTNLEGTHNAAPVLQVDLAFNLRIKIDKLPAQFIEAELIQLRSQFCVGTRQLREPMGKGPHIQTASADDNRGLLARIKVSN